MNLLARTMRSLMRARGVEGTFCIGPQQTYYEWRGMRLVYHYSDFGTGGNIDSGGNTEDATRTKLISILKEQARPVFYDIGAHDGLFTITVKQAVPQTVVHAFEPHAHGLFANLALNG